VLRTAVGAPHRPLFTLARPGKQRSSISSIVAYNGCASTCSRHHMSNLAGRVVYMCLGQRWCCTSLYQQRTAHMVFYTAWLYLLLLLLPPHLVG
jgi:hypothetical protein